MRVVVISDTHGRHERLGVLEGDVLIHCGDFCDGFTRDPHEVESVDAWFAEQKFETIFCVGGNHDFGIFGRIDQGLPVFHSAVWLQDATHTHRGIRFYGAPWIPQLDGWAFYLTSEGLQKKWSLIPKDTDVLITHTPPLGVLDENSRGKQCGCAHLLERVGEVKPRLHLFGHIHASAGRHENGATTFINASLVDSRFDLNREPIVIDLDASRAPDRS